MKDIFNKTNSIPSS